VIFNLLVSQVMLNLFILVILQQFEKYYIDENGPLKRFKADQTVFLEAWCNDTAKYQCIKIREKHLFNFFKKLPESIRSRDADIKKGGQSESEIKKTMLRMGIRNHNGYIYFNELLYRLMQYKYFNFQLNKTMWVRELIMQYKLFELTMKMMNLKLQKPQE